MNTDHNFTPEQLAAAFTIAPYDLRDIGRGWGATSIAVAVHGYWSRDPIQIRVSRDIDWNKARELGEDRHVWTVTVSHSSGGRDGAVIADDVQAEENFGHALVAAAAEARKIREQIPAIAAFNAEWRAEEEAARAAKKAAEQAKIDADPAMGNDAADALLDKALKSLAELRPPCQWNSGIYARGSDLRNNLLVERTRGGVAQFTIAGTKARSRKDAVARLAEFSARTSVPQA